MAPPNGTPKTMSSRLMNMKFMQRAAASDTSTPSTPAEPAAKRQRLSNGSFKSTPVSTPQSEPEVPTPEEQKREEAFAHEAAARGDSKWYLSFQEPQSPAVSSPLRIVSAGYGALDSAGLTREQSSDDEEEARPQMAGRRSFGKFNRATEKQQQDNDESDLDDSSSSASDDSEDYDPDSLDAMISSERKQAGDKARAERKAKRKAEGAEAARMADERRKKEVNLNNVTSISGFGGGGSRKPKGLENMICHKCGGQGHMKARCPQTEELKRKRGVC